MATLLDVYYLPEVSYFPAWDLQKKWVQQIDRGERPDTLLLLQHPHTFTLGRSGKEEHLLIGREQLQREGITLAHIDRGGDITYHGPGQIVGYPLIYLGESGDPHKYLRELEQVLIDTLAQFRIVGARKPTYTGVWVDDLKIAAIGVKFNRGIKRKGFISSHGFALNVNTDLSMFNKIVPCGITEYGVTSMEQILGYSCDIREVMEVIRLRFDRIFHTESRVASQENANEIVNKLSHID